MIAILLFCILPQYDAIIEAYVQEVYCLTEFWGRLLSGVYLLTYSLFNSTVSSSDYIASDGGIISE
jgi:hypothetical protein